MVTGRLLSLISSAGQDVEKYYLTLSTLTPKDVYAQTSVAGSSGLPQDAHTALFALLAPMLLFIVIFVSVFGIFLLGRIKNWKMGVTALLLALTLGATPYVLQMINQGTDRSVNASPDETPSNVRVVPLSQTSVQVVWETGVEKIGAVRISRGLYDIRNTRIIMGDAGGRKTSHAVVIDNLEQNANYEFEVLSGSRWYNNNGSTLKFQME